MSLDKIAKYTTKSQNQREAKMRRIGHKRHAAKSRIQTLKYGQFTVLAKISWIDLPPKYSENQTVSLVSE